jgi:hypothetical protein
VWIKGCTHLQAKRIRHIDEFDKPDAEAQKKPMWPWLLLLVVTLVLIYAYFIWTATIDYLFSGASDLFHALEWVINFLDEQKAGQN